MSLDEARPDGPPAALPRTYLLPCLLLLLAECSSYGYDLLERLASLGVEPVDPGGLYRLLRSMEADGLLASEWERSNAGPPRRRYRVTPDGRAHLDAWAVSLGQMRRSVDGYLRRHQAVSNQCDAVPAES